jgi:HlyD family secretion protein
MKRLLRFLIRMAMYLTLLAVLVGGLVWFFWPRPLPVEWTTVSRGRLHVTVDEDGKTRIRQRYVVSSPLAGRLLRSTLDPGDAVQRGSTLLATIEPNEPEILDDRALAQAEARVRAAEAVWNRVEPAVERARIEWEHAEAEWTRFRKLAETASVSAQQVDEAEMIYRARQQDLRSAQLAQDIARFEWDLAKAALLQATPSEIDSPTPRRFDIHSPIDGRVLRVLERSETAVQSGTPLLELGDVYDLEVEVDVLSPDAVKISPGTRAFLERWGGDRPLAATVRLVEPAAFTKISALGVEEQRVNVILDLKEPPDQRPQLGDAFRVEARIVIWEAEDVLQVPTGALFRQRNDWAVFLIEENRATLRIVEVGHRNSLSAQILAGLEEGDRVILHPSDQVTDGSPIVLRSLAEE